ncbi:hypothetical protein D0Y65_009700 [Glycine soja]|uniref:Uncharacterized protein n=1 Tax=Glycine soja TaxID=3848 RepID=A0A445L084_GLYSO|nr:hypothetical protein D0Y65_009700 [Glycine soja]
MVRGLLNKLVCRSLYVAGKWQHNQLRCLNIHEYQWLNLLVCALVLPISKASYVPITIVQNAVAKGAVVWMGVHQLTILIRYLDQGLTIGWLHLSTNESTNKVVVCVGVLEKGGKGKLDMADWLNNALGPLKGRCGKGKGGLATGQLSY